MAKTHPTQVEEFSDDEEHFFEFFDRAYEKVLSQAESWERSDSLRVSPFGEQRRTRSLVNVAYAFH